MNSAKAHARGRSSTNEVVGVEGERRSEVKEEAASRRRGTFAEPLPLGADDRSRKQATGETTTPPVRTPGFP